MAPIRSESDNGITPTLVIEAWHDPLIGSAGHDPRSAYANAFWLPILGPSSQAHGAHRAAPRREPGRRGRARSVGRPARQEGRRRSGPQRTDHLHAPAAPPIRLDPAAPTAGSAQHLSGQGRLAAAHPSPGRTAPDARPRATRGRLTFDGDTVEEPGRHIVEPGGGDRGRPRRRAGSLLRTTRPRGGPP